MEIADIIFNDSFFHLQLIISTKIGFKSSIDEQKNQIITKKSFTGAVKFLVVQIDTFLVFTINLKEGRSGIFHHLFHFIIFSVCSVHLQMVHYWFKCHKQKYYCFEFALKCEMCSLQIELLEKNITE